MVCAEQKYKALYNCPDCEGTGCLEGQYDSDSDSWGSPTTCWSCDGWGYITWTRMIIKGMRRSVGHKEN